MRTITKITKCGDDSRSWYIVFIQIHFWCLFAVVVESFAMGADTVLASACNSGCMAIN